MRPRFLLERPIQTTCFKFSFPVQVGKLVTPDRPGGGGGGVLPYVGYIGMCRCEGYGFQAVYPRIGYIRAFGSRIGYHFSGH